MLENLKISKIQKCVSCLHSLNIFVSISHKSKVKVSVRISFPLPSIIPQYFQVFKSVDCSLNCPLLRNLPEAMGDFSILFKEICESSLLICFKYFGNFQWNVKDFSMLL